MSNSTVIIIYQNSYDENQIYEKICAGTDALGGIAHFAAPQEKILVKPNFLTSDTPDGVTVTNPAVIRSVLKMFSDSGYSHVSMGDSPGHGTCKAVAAGIGLTEDNLYGAAIAPMNEEVLTPFPEGKTANEFYFAREVTEADAIINVCKMKTHALETITGAVKNVYGLICGMRKAAGHVKYPNASIFARMLADIHLCVKPRLHIMDGISAMEGNGPGSGTPAPMNLLLMSEDPVALDTVFCRLVYVDPQDVPTCAQGESCGIGTMQENEITLKLIDKDKNGSLKAVPVTFNELVSNYGNSSFNVLRTGKGKSFLARYSRFMTHFQKKPAIDTKICTHCGVCVSHCPVPGKAVSFANGREKPPVYDYSKCIRCYCCQEMCPSHAIKAK